MAVKSKITLNNCTESLPDLKAIPLFKVGYEATEIKHLVGYVIENCADSSYGYRTTRYLIKDEKGFYFQSSEVYDNIRAAEIQLEVERERRLISLKKQVEDNQKEIEALTK